jgi:hypothetical protein
MTDRSHSPLAAAARAAAFLGISILTGATAGLALARWPVAMPGAGPVAG